jgi:uncharacterized protein YfaS (alpha-2-macroglobulin family)
MSGFFGIVAALGGGGGGEVGKAWMAAFAAMTAEGMRVGGRRSTSLQKFFAAFFQKRSAFLLLLFLCVSGTARAEDVLDTDAVVKQPAGAVVVPDRFLRRWDPVTIFFDHDMGAAAGAAAGAADDAPGAVVSMTPAQPGAWTWLNGKTLQFRPAVPWPPLSSFDVRVKEDSGWQDVALSRLLDPTVQTDPANGTTGISGLRTISLTFGEPLDVKALAGMLDIAISPLPGLDAAQAQHLTPADFDIKTVERTAPSDQATYLVELHRPVPDGMAVAVDIGLSPVPGLVGTVEHLDFSTAVAFAPALMGCADARVPVSAAGTVYDKSAALDCSVSGDGGQSADNSDNGSADNSDAGDSGDGSMDQSSGDQTPDSDQAAAPAPVAAGNLPTTSAKTPSVGTPDLPASLGTASAATPREIVVEFSAPPGAVDPVTARNFLRISPAVDGVATTVAGNELHVAAKFLTGTLYQVTLAPAGLRDASGRPLAMTGASAVWLYWPAEPNSLALAVGNGVVERYGPQMIPLSGRGYAQADVRLHAIDPLDRSFWPFPATPVPTNDNDRPPAPGEEAAAYAGDGPIDQTGLQAQLARLGSPSVSTLAPLPLTAAGPSARFGLDLTDEFARISGRQNPGTYLIGVRALDQAGDRDWMRVQVTDLSVTTVEEEKAVKFYVTSLRSGMPVAGASVEIDGDVNGNFTKLDGGVTDADGGYVWPVADDVERTAPARIVVSKDDDVLVIDPAQPPDRYTAAGWTSAPQDWLAWTAAQTFDDRHPAPQILCHMFTERPIYRPEDPVHIKVFVRQLADGVLSAPGDHKVQLSVTGPDSDDNWQYNVTPDAAGDLHYLFDQKTTATGTYQAELDVDGTACATVSFQKDAYRLPKFQITMNGPGEIALDKPANIGMTAVYYAGGPVEDRPVRWRVTAFPYGFAPAARPGFVYGTDAMFQTDFSGQSNAALESEGTTDKEGRASVTVDPTQEASNAPRRYVVEATVTGDDDKTVTNTQAVLALPSFVLGLQAPRFLQSARAIPVQVLMVDADGKPIAGKPITLRLLRRQWSSILQASDFSDGVAKYQTEVVDEKLIERTVISGSDVVKLNLPIDKAGVYIVQLEAADSLGRLQTVSEDLFAAGANPVSWSRPPATVFKVTTDRPDYVPGDTAKLILESPFQTGRALAIVELPTGAETYQWLDIKDGYGVFSLPIDKSFMPRIPVHFVLMRGRLPGDGGTTGLLDLRRPQTIAATAWVGVKPVKNIVTASVTAPAEALPGATVQVTVKLADDAGKPVSGTVTLWLIDQAVLALAAEAPLDPLPDFVRDRGSDLAFSDTRNWPFGLLPLDEDPGGEALAALALAPMMAMDLLDKVTVRKNFNPMPYYNPDLAVGPSGTVTVSIKLPDDLTNFKIRAVADSGEERFGFAVGQISVRLPVIVEPNLPRFVRPGDAFSLAGIGRVVEGPGGAGQVQMAVEGLNLSGPSTSNFTWTPGMGQSFAFPVTVPSPGYTPQGDLARTSVKVTMAVERAADKAMDAFSVDLPIEPDRDPVNQRVLADLSSGKVFVLPAIEGAARPGTVRRALVISNQPELVRLYAGLDYLRDYPFGCTEQRVSLARAELAMRQFAAMMGAGADDRTAADVNETLTWITAATGPDGLVGFWPGDPGVVTLTAWAVEFMVEAQKAGFAVDPVEFASLTHALKESLRSDYPNFVSGGAYEERAWALAALAYAGQLDRDYADELARQKDELSLEGLAQVSLALEQGGAADAPLLPPLRAALWNGLVVKLRDGKVVYGGLQEGESASVDYPRIFPSETRTLAEMLRATADTNDPRRQVIVAALAGLGAGDGWGSTNADAEATLALTAYLKGNTGAPAQSMVVGTQNVALTGTKPVDKMVFFDGGAVKIDAAGATAARKISVLDDLTWLPVADGSTVAPVADGFVVTSESDLVAAAGPMTRVPLDHAGVVLTYKVGDVIEDHVEVVNPVDRHYVAITVPLAAGMEPLDPTLLTAPPEATPSSPPTLAPSYVAFLDDRVGYFYDTLPAGTYEFYFRTKAAVPGRFIQPAAKAVMMYDDAVSGGGAGAVVVVGK